MECILAEGIKLGNSPYCPYLQKRCDGTMNIEWRKDYALIPINKTCINQSMRDPKKSTNVFIEVSANDLNDILKGDQVLMVRTHGGGVCFVKVCEK